MNGIIVTILSMIFSVFFLAVAVSVTISPIGLIVSAMFAGFACVVAVDTYRNGGAI